jgi:Zn-dependent protease with chaperone function
VWRRIDRWDSRAGFHADRLLARTGLDDVPPRWRLRLLLAVSAALVLALAASLTAAAWLFVAGSGPGSFLLGVLLLVLAWLLRPRVGRLKRLVADGDRVSARQAPALHAVIGRIAAAVEAPAPDVLVLDYSWNAAAATAGFRQTRVLFLGVPLLLALSPQQIVALIGHELGHFRHDTGPALLTRPALTVFGGLSALFRPPRGSAIDRGLGGLYALMFLLYQVVGGTISLLLYGVHLALHLVAAPDGRRAELRADAMAARAAGTVAALEVIDLLPLLPELSRYVQHHVPEDRLAGEHWRGLLSAVRDREQERAPMRRQLTNRTHASLFASHPAPGRRHEWLGRRPVEQPSVVLDAETGAAIQRELGPYAKAMQRALADVELI